MTVIDGVEVYDEWPRTGSCKKMHKHATPQAAQAQAYHLSCKYNQQKVVYWCSEHQCYHVGSPAQEIVWVEGKV